MPAYDDIYRHGRKSPANVDKQRVPVVSGLLLYPTYPKGLPPDLFNFVYPDIEDPPLGGSMQRYNVLRLQHIPLRTTSKLLSWNYKGTDSGRTRSGNGRHAICDSSRKPVLNLGGPSRRVVAR